MPQNALNQQWQQEQQKQRGDSVVRTPLGVAAVVAVALSLLDSRKNTLRIKH